MKLNPVKHDAKGKNWCGPFVLAALSGKPTSAVRRVLAAVLPRKRTMGLYGSELVAAAAYLGIRLAPVPELSNSGSTLRRWALHAVRSADTTYVVATGHHWVLVRGNRFYDNRAPKPVSVRRAWCKRTRVTMVYAAVPCEAKALPPVAPPDKSGLSDVHRARRLATKFGIEITMEEFGKWYVVHPRLEPDPFDGDHYVFDAQELLARVRAYVEALNRRAPLGCASAS